MLAWPDVLGKQCLPRTRDVVSSAEADYRIDAWISSEPGSRPLVSSNSSALSFSMGFGLPSLIDRPLFPPRMQELLHKVKSCGYLARFVFQSPQATSDDAHSLCMSLLRLHHSVLAQRFGGAAEALRLCLVLILSYILARLSSSSANWNAVRLASAVGEIEDLESPQKVTFAELLLWIFIVSAFAPTMKIVIRPLVEEAVHQSGRSGGEGCESGRSK